MKAHQEWQLNVSKEDMTLIPMLTTTNIITRQQATEGNVNFRKPV